MARKKRAGARNHADKYMLYADVERVNMPNMQQPETFRKTVHSSRNLPIRYSGNHPRTPITLNSSPTATREENARGAYIRVKDRNVLEGVPTLQEQYIFTFWARGENRSKPEHEAL